MRPGWRLARDEAEDHLLLPDGRGDSLLQRASVEHGELVVSCPRLARKLGRWTSGTRSSAGGNSTEGSDGIWFGRSAGRCRLCSVAVRLYDLNVGHLPAESYGPSLSTAPIRQAVKSQHRRRSLSSSGGAAWKHLSACLGRYIPRYLVRHLRLGICSEPPLLRTGHLVPEHRQRTAPSAYIASRGAQDPKQ